MPSALVGWVLENDNGQQEGACFWIVSKDAEGALEKLNNLPNIDNTQEMDFLSIVLNPTFV